MNEKTLTNPRGAGRTPSLTRQTESLVKRVMSTNKKLDRGLTKVADNYGDLMQTAVDVALGHGVNKELDQDGNIRQVPRNPSVPMLKVLIEVGVDMVDKTGEGPDSPSQRILSSMRNKVAQLTQVNIEHITIANGDNPDPVERDSY